MLLFVTNMVTINFYWTISLNFILRCVSSPGTLPAPVLLRYCSVPVNAPFIAFSRRSFLLPEKQKRVNQRPDLSFSMRHRPQFNIPFALGTNATARPILLAAGISALDTQVARTCMYFASPSCQFTSVGLMSPGLTAASSPIGFATSGLRPGVQ